MSSDVYDVIVVGAGPAGLTAAIYASRLKLKTLVIGAVPGGLVTEAYIVENYPGFKSIRGFELASRIVEHAKECGAEILEGQRVVKARRLDGLFEVETDWGEAYRSRALILAYGLRRRKLGVPGEEKLAGRGVSYCAVCDAPLFKGKVVAVIGGSDSAVTGALQLAEVAEKVYIIYRRGKLRAEPAWVERALGNPKIEVIYNTKVVEIVGEEKLDYVILDSPYKGSRELKLDGLFVEIGFEPDPTLARQLGVELDEEGLIKIKPDCSTSIPGVFAAGDATTGSNKLRQIVTSAAEGAIAAESVYLYLARQKVERG